MTSARTNEAMYNVLLNDDDFMESLDYMFEDFVSETDSLDEATGRLAEFISDELNDFCWLLAERYVEDTDWIAGSESRRSMNRPAKGSKAGKSSARPKSASNRSKAPSKKVSAKKTAPRRR